MVDILIVNPYMMASDPNELRFKKPFPPLGMLYVASTLCDHGYDVQVCDLTFEKNIGPFDKIARSSPAWVGIYSTSVTRRQTLNIAERARKAGSRVIFGGPDPSSRPGEYLMDSSDVVVTGEGENTSRMIMEGSVDKVPGTAFLGEDGNVVSIHGDVIGDIDSIPFPARDLIDIGKYMRMWKENHGYSIINILTSRGCPYGCKWCCKPVFGNSFRQRSPENVLMEVEDIKNKYAPDRLWFSDDILPMDPNWVRSFSDCMSSTGLDFECLGRVDLLNENVVSSLSFGGCKRIYLGVESGSQKVLDSMNKGITISQIHKVSPLLKKAGIEQYWFIMYGYPGENRRDILKTISMAAKLSPEKFGITIAYPLPGTEFYEDVKDNIIREDWVQTLDNKLIFEREYSESFYRVAILWTHGVVRSGRFVRKIFPPISGGWDALTILSARFVLKVLSKIPPGRTGDRT